MRAFRRFAFFTTATDYRGPKRIIRSYRVYGRSMLPYRLFSEQFSRTTRHLGRFWSFFPKMTYWMYFLPILDLSRISRRFFASISLMRLKEFLMRKLLP